MEHGFPLRRLVDSKTDGWIYTAVWETWDAIAPDGHVNVASFNHYVFGCVGDWVVRFVAGLNKDKP
jgi:alpha-L-rhamnosidase